MDAYSGDINNCYFIYFLLICVCLSLYNYIMNNFSKLRSFYYRKMIFLTWIFQLKKSSVILMIPLKNVRYFMNDCIYIFLRTIPN